MYAARPITDNWAMLMYGTRFSYKQKMPKIIIINRPITEGKRACDKQA
jgi:hypothetical protein